MTLIIGKIDKRNKKQMMWSDGILKQGDMVSSNNSRKISSFTDNDIHLVIGTSGVHTWNRYVRNHLLQELKKSKYLCGCLNDTDYAEERLTDIFLKMLDDYRDHSGNKGEISFGHVVLLNGHMYLVETTGDDYEVTTTEVTDRDYVCSGMGQEAAECMMLLKIPPEKIFNAISTVYSSVNDNVMYLEEKYGSEKSEKNTKK